jgi:PST family polysaccharide transporter
MEQLKIVYKKILLSVTPNHQSSAQNVYFDDNEAREGLAKQSLRSGAFSVFSKALNVIIHLGSTIVLARLLLPEDFGLFAMVAALTGFAPALIDLGTKDAAVQKSRITHDEISALFWLSAVIGVVLTLTVAVCAPLIASFYHEPRLEKIAQVWALIFTISALSNQHIALLRRALMFQKIGMIEVGANLVGAGGAIWMALAGYGYWALVFKPMFTALFTLLGVGLSCRWVPKFPRYSAGVREMLTFGVQITAFATIDYFGRALDRVGLGYVSGAQSLGYYQNACLAYENPLSTVVIPLHSVAVATLSKLRNNLDELRKGWSTALSSLCFFAMPAFVILAVTGQDVVILLLGEKWFYAGTLLSVIALRGPAHVVERSQGWLHVAAGRTDRWMRWGIVSFCVQVIALFCGMPFGTMGIAIAYTVCPYLLFMPAIVYSGVPFGIGTSHLLKAVGPQLIASVCAAGVGFLLRFNYLAHTSMMPRIMILVFVCVAVYLLITVGLFEVVKPLKVARSLISDFLPTKLSRLLPTRFMN